jgi:hypothetical protein
MIESLNFLASISGFVSSQLGAGRELPSCHSSDQESKQRNPIFRMGNVKRANGRKKKEVEARRGQQRR